MPLGSSAGVGAGIDLKDEAQVKDYLDNLGMEYRFGCYHEKNPKSCHMLADYWEGIKKDYAKSYKTYTTNCNDYNYGASCHKAAGYSYFGKGTTRNGDLAFDFFKKGCELGHYASCLNAGLLEMSNPNNPEYIRTQKPNQANGLEFFKKSCEEGASAEACHRYGSAFIRGMKDVCAQDMKKAFDYSLKACELGSMAGCRNVTVMYRKGDGVEKNPEAAKHYADITMEMMDQLKEQEGWKSGGGLEEESFK
eukprot:TRINITY_DN1941_c0_g1_i1.p1 TRINITY_DN1941_c0_g1~~TRINITY_DN1941_c0_g1_i1.p1  ORF type:complete len:250 (-),score=41.94 TRINITY_DN1941_c0_g1_i1:14-763(-)